MAKIIVDTAVFPKEATNLGQIPSVVLTGLSTATVTPVVATDTILQAIGKLQGARAFDYTLNFKFTRIGFLSGNYSGGNCDIPYSEYSEDGTRTHTGRGVRASTTGRVTAVTFSMTAMAGDCTIYLKKNGTVTNVGTLTSALKYVTLIPTAYNFVAGDEILVGFSSTTNGTYSYLVATVFIRDI